MSDLRGGLFTHSGGIFRISTIAGPHLNTTEKPMEGRGGWARRAANRAPERGFVANYRPACEPEASLAKCQGRLGLMKLGGARTLY
jgi:hypothetical protein